MSRIVFLNRFYDPDESATAQMLTDLATGLARHGRDVAVVTSRQRADDARAALPARETRDGVTIVRVRTARFGRRRIGGRTLDYLTFQLSAAAALVGLLREGDVLVAMTDPPLLSVMALPVARHKRARLVNWLQDLYPETATALGILPPAGRITRLLARWRNRSLQAADSNVAIGRRMAALVRALGVPARRVALIPNWADGEAIRPLAHRDNPLRTTWFPQDDFVVAYSGNMGRAHALEGLLGAAGLIAGAAARPGEGVAARVRFLFVGSGQQEAKLRMDAAAAGLGNVTFQPFRPRSGLRQSLGLADLHVVALKPRLEGLIVPSKLYGALAAGRPVLFLGAADSEVSELLATHDCGTAADPGDPLAIADKILARARAPELCQRQGENARRLFEETFSRRAAVQSWVDLLEALSDETAGETTSATPAHRG